MITPAEWQVIACTLGVCAFSTLLITPFGLAPAWLLARKSGELKLWSKRWSRCHWSFRQSQPV